MFTNQQLIYLIAVGLFPIGTQAAIAQSTANIPTPTNSSKSQQIMFKPPPSKGQPKSTSSAGSRGDLQCPQDATSTALSNQPPLIPLVPSDSNFGLTTAEHPTFLVYLPPTSAKQVILSLIAEDNQVYSQTFIPIKGEPGIISLKSADSTPPLEVGKNYQWAVVLVCNEKPSPNDPVVTSWVRRVGLPQPENYQKADLKQANAYSQQGIWYDAVITLARIRNTQPDNQAVVNIWTNFLKSVGLDAIATQPLRLEK